MTAEEVMKIVRDMPEDERNKVFYGLMKDFDKEMSDNSEFRQHAIDAMNRLMGKRAERGESISEFKSFSAK